MDVPLQPGILLHQKGQLKPGLSEMGESGVKVVQKELVCLTKSDSMSIGSASDVASVGGASEEMDTEDSEKDAREGFLSSGRSNLSLMDEQRKQTLGGLDLVLDGQVNRTSVGGGVLGEGMPVGDITSPVIENKLSDDVDGYYAMRSRLLSQSAVILENGGAFGKRNRLGMCDDQNANHANESSGSRSESNTPMTKSHNSSLALVSGYDSDSCNSDSDTEMKGLCVTDTTVQKSLKDNVPSHQSQHLHSNNRDDSQVIIKELGIVDDSTGNDERISPSPKIEVKREPLSDDESELSRTTAAEAVESSASECMVEVIEKFGLEAKLARVSKRRIYSKVRERAKDAQSSSESDSDSDSDDDEEDDDRDMILDNLHEAKVLVNAAQPDSEKMIRREVLKMACTDDLLSDYGSSEDSSASSSDSSSGESSDSDSDSSADESDDDEEEEVQKPQPVQPRRQPTVSKDGLRKGLAEVEYLNIALPDSVDLNKLGMVSSIIGSLVIVQAEPGTPALNAETVLFKPDRAVLGQIYEIFGPVISPFYSIRFNCPADIEQQGIRLKTEALFAPQNIDVTQYVFTNQLRKSTGTDASWDNDDEVPDEFQDYSDDEAEALARNHGIEGWKRKVPQKRKESGQDNRNQGRRQGQQQGNGHRDAPRVHPPLQRKFAGHTQQRFQHPPQSGRFGPPPPRNQFSQHAMQGGTPYCHNAPRGSYHGWNAQQRPSNPWGARPSYGSSSGQFPPQSPHPALQFEGPPRPPGVPLFNPAIPPPMFQNPHVANLPTSTDLTQIPPLMPFASPQDAASQQPVRGFSARHLGSPVPSLPGGGNQVQGMYSARETGVPPPWQMGIPPPPPAWLTTPPPPHSTAPQAGVASPVWPTQPSTSVQQASNQQPLFNMPPTAPATNSLPQVAATWICQPPPPPPTGKKLTTSTTQQSLATPATSQPPSMWNTQVQWGQVAVKNDPQATSQFPTPTFPPAPVPPPSFHPRMMQSFRGMQTSQGAQSTTQPSKQ